MNHLRITIIISILIGITMNSCKKEEVPTITTNDISNITGTTATCGGIITGEGTGIVILRGVCWSTNTNPTIVDQKTVDGAGAGTFTSNITELNGATTYYVRAYATNSAGTGYGMTMSFRTLGQIATAKTKAETNITTTSVTLNGEINPNYLSTTVSFEYGTSISFGLEIQAIQSPLSGSVTSAVTTEVTGLVGGTIYHFRVKAVNSEGTVYGLTHIFQTSGARPYTETRLANKITETSATLNGIINPNLLPTIVTFEYGLTTDYGSSVPLAINPIIGNSGTTHVSKDITGLNSNSIYHYRIVATNSVGTTYGEDQSFTNKTVTDTDGNIYKIVIIGNQTWMAENLKTTRYRNGDLIGTTIPASLDISSETRPKYQWAYEGNEDNVPLYGRLYTWYTVTDDRNICPTGWHVTSNAEWEIMIDRLVRNGNGIGGIYEIAKSIASTYGWNFSSTEGSVGYEPASNNSSGLALCPGGFRWRGNYMDFSDVGHWWTSTIYDDNNNSICRDLLYLNSGFGGYTGKYNHCGSSVRCIKD